MSRGKKALRVNIKGVAPLHILALRRHGNQEPVGDVPETNKNNENLRYLL